MSRLEPVPDGDAGIVAGTAFRFARRTLRKKIGADVVPTPLRVMAHNTNVMQGFGLSEQFLARSKSLPVKLQGLAREAVAALVGCHW